MHDGTPGQQQVLLQHEADARIGAFDRHLIKQDAALARPVEAGDKAATEAAFARAAHVVDIDVVNNRLIINYMEPRAAIAGLVIGGFSAEASGVSLAFS